MKFKMFAMKQSIMGDQPPAGGGTPSPSGGEPNGGGNSPPTERLPDWLKDIEPDVANDPILKGVKDVKDVIKGYVHAQRLVGRDKVVVPTNKSTPEEWKAYFAKVGLPESEDKYDFKAPEKMDAEKLAKFKKLAYENNILPNQMEKIVQAFEEDKKATMDWYDSQEKERVEATKTELIKEWGEQGFQKNIGNALKVAKHFGGDEFIKYLDESGLGNDGNLIRMFAKIGEKLQSEDTFDQEIVGHFGMTKSQAQEEINKIFGDPMHPYFNKQDPRHGDAMKKMLQFQEILAQK